jgi:tetratricopeptide (TPR) repeat protein
VVDNLIQQGLRHHRAGRMREAKILYEQVLAENPRHPDALHLLGLTALQSGAPGKAAELIRIATTLQPENPAFHANLAAALTELGELDEALAAFRRAARLNPDEPQFQMGIANCHARRGEYANAEAQLRDITQQFPGFALAWFNLGNAVRDQGRVAEAVDCYQRAIAADSRLLDAHINLGGALHALGRFDEAEHAYRCALALAPDHAIAHCNLASVLIDCGRFPAAEAACRQAIARDPQSAIAHSFLGAAIGHQGRLHAALEFYRRAVALDPGNVRTLMGLGSACCELGMPAEGLPLLERALALAPDSWEAHAAMATVKLALGEIQDGWREYIHRPAHAQFTKLHPDVMLSSALPATLTGRHVCVLGEQGLGDEFFFLRFARHLKARGARVTYRAAPKIASILERVAAIDCVIPDPQPLPPADYTLLAGDLPPALASNNSPLPTMGADFSLFPPSLELTPLADQLAAIANRLAQLGPPPYLGLTWRGGVRPEEQRETWTLSKQIPLPQFGAALRGVKGTMLALQRNPAPGEIEQISASAGKAVHDLTALNEDLEAMLALLALIDDYIGVSNTNMHLRAGVGKTARVLVPCPAEWRWMAQGTESPWFPGFAVYRQSTRGDWESALAALRRDLAASC